MSNTFTPPPPSPETLAAWAETQREPAEAEPRAPAKAAPSAAPRRGRARRLLTAAFVVGCALGGAAASKALLPKPAPPEVAAAPAESHEPDATPANLPPAQGAGLAARIDTNIRAAGYADALRMLHDAPPNTFADETLVAYREGLCLEGLGKPDEAATAFQKAERDPNVGGWARALLGRARCALAANALRDARELIDRVLLRSGHPECRGGRIYEEAVHMRARVAVAELGAPAVLDPLNAEALAWPNLGAAPDAYLDWLPLDAPAASPNPDTGRDVIEIHREKDARNPEVTLRLAKRPAFDVVRALATATELELRADGTVTKLLAGVVGPVEVERLPFDSALAALTERAGVAWAVKSGVLHLTLAPRAPSAEVAGLALRKAIDVAPEPHAHPAAGAMRVALANIDYRAGRSRAAADGYKSVLDDHGNPPEATHAAYNLGLSELKGGNRKATVARFLEVIDRSPHTRFAEFAWCWIGRSHLEGDDPGSARQAYLTAFNGKTKEGGSAAALGICACDLLIGNEDEVRKLVEDVRFSTRESHTVLVRFYTRLLRYRTAPTENRRELLLQALQRADDCRALGPAGAYLAGRIYAELGLASRLTALYEREVETARGPLALRMLYDTAERYDRLDQRASARSGYLSLAAVDPDGLGGMAELKLAALDARDGKGAEAVRRCWALVNRKNVPRAELLAVMGHGYELQKMHAAAAACFSGQLPE